jgi:hypothetical protein
MRRITPSAMRPTRANKKVSRTSNMKTYADVLLSPALSTRLLITSCNGSLLGAILYIFGIDKTLAGLLSRLIDINFADCYWLVYIFVLGTVLALNLHFIFSETHNCLSDLNDWDRVKNFIFQDRPVYNFNTGRKELTKIPLYVFISLGLLIVFGLLSSVNVLILSPLVKMFATESNSEYVFRYSSGVFYGTFVISNIPPYLLLLMKILPSQAVLNFKRWIR